MTRPIYGSRLLSTARKLAGVGSGAGRPAVSDLRRATSTAYYAVFHQIVRHSALDFLPSATENEVADLARWYTHTGLIAASELVNDAAGPRALSGVGKNDRTAVMSIRSSAGGSVPRQPVVVADALQTLQAARHSADYDGNYTQSVPSRSTTSKTPRPPSKRRGHCGVREPLRNRSDGRRTRPTGSSSGSHC